MRIIDASFVPLVWEDAIDLLAAAIDLGGEYTHEAESAVMLRRMLV